MSGRVLVVDDDKTLCETLQAALEKAGFSVRTAYDGRQCLEAIAAERPDVLVLDVAMPVMDGYRTLHRLRGDSRTHLLPVVLLTGHPGEPGELAGWMAGIDRYLAKPCDITRLVSVVQELIPGSPAA